MKSLIWVFSLVLASSNGFAATSVVEGKIAKVVSSKSEIYVEDSTSGKKHEYYFKKDTKLLKGGQPVEFAELKVGQSVRVTAEKKGKRLDPQTVEILE